MIWNLLTLEVAMHSKLKTRTFLVYFHLNVFAYTENQIVFEPNLAHSDKELPCF